MPKKAFASQFKKGTFPDQQWDESVRTNGPELSSPSKAKQRLGRPMSNQNKINKGAK